MCSKNYRVYKHYSETLSEGTLMSLFLGKDHNSKLQIVRIPLFLYLEKEETGSKGTLANEEDPAARKQLPARAIIRQEVYYSENGRNEYVHRDRSAVSKEENPRGRRPD